MRTEELALSSAPTAAGGDVVLPDTGDVGALDAFSIRIWFPSCDTDLYSFPVKRSIWIPIEKKKKKKRQQFGSFLIGEKLCAWFLLYEFFLAC